MSDIEVEVFKARKKLVARAAKKGVWENFGQREYRDLCDKFMFKGVDFMDIRFINDQLEKFFEWCVNYTGEER